MPNTLLFGLAPRAIYSLLLDFYLAYYLLLGYKPRAAIKSLLYRTNFNLKGQRVLTDKIKAS
ncbi:hypothetical protein EU508_20450 [Pseudoalteromonas fuliginea]|uniref:Uncharacterized protein n=1 Tax=Pseudoalteromonas fuliginea TaxID=1872678 RepID=A0AB73BBL4_9GAMM|nr:hypothetical protein EU508_20450 [Pseudoalteromonas fuliginea]